jgi:HEAT repeat protein
MREVRESLKGRIADEKEHIYVQLEAAAALARQGEAAGMEFIEGVLASDYLEQKLEAVIILGEIRNERSEQILIHVLLNRREHAEIRAGAAWALGELQQATSIDALIESFLELAVPIRIEAARALRRIAVDSSARVLSKLPEAADDQRAGIAWAVSRATKIPVADFINVMKDDDARRWVAYIIGSQREDTYVGEIEQLRKRDPEVYFAVTVLWKIFASWVYKLEEV